MENLSSEIPSENETENEDKSTSTGSIETEESSEKDEHIIEESKSFGSASSGPTCRVCLDTKEDESLVTLCLCRGTIGNVHKSCLERWLATNNSHSCELCGFRFNTVRRPMFKPVYSVYYWVFKERDLDSRTRFCADAVFSCIIFPLICLSIYACLAVATNHSQLPVLSAATSWIAISAMLVTAALSLGFCLWLPRTIQYHGKSWYYWWQAKNEVRILPPLPASERIWIETTV